MLAGLPIPENHTSNTQIHDINFVVVCADSHNPYRRRDLHWVRFIVHETKQTKESDIPLRYIRFQLFIFF
nr:MAG TPA: hypothetical protein [Myoviridae sp. ctNPX13]